MPVWQAAAGAVVAAGFARGKLSPDADQRGVSAWLIPGGHRGVTHWPVALAVLAVAAVVFVPPGWQWAARAVLAGWTSHLAMDGIFGRIPVWPTAGGWRRAGLGLRTGGITERLATPLLALTVAVLALNLAHTALT
jgi:membrane-bound metal-dependent hydrolase YbcI (DUF457 family)